MADSLEKDLSMLVQWVEASEEASETSRKESEIDRDYYDNKQWTDGEIQALKKRGQPVITINRIKRKIDFLIGQETLQRSDPKAFPRTPHDEAASFAATDSIRFVLSNNNWDVIRSSLWFDLLIHGACGVEVLTEQTKRGWEVALNSYEWDRLGWDPHSTKKDFSDARYKYAVIWKDKDELLEQWPNAAEAIDTTLTEATNSDTYDDKPKHSLWADSKRQRVRVVMIYYTKKGVWHWSLFTKGGVIDSGEVPYLDEDEKTECPLIMTSAYVDRDNNRYGVVREMRGAQDEINKRRSKALHLLSARQAVVDKGAVESVRKMKAELAKPDGVVEKKPNMTFDLLQNGDMTQGHFNLMQEAKNEIDLMGPNAAMQGKGQEGQSGRAILAQQQGGNIEMGQMTDRLRQLSLEVYRQVWNRIRQYWDEERWVRVTDNEDNVRFVGVNRPITAGEEHLKQLEEQGMPPEQIEQEAQYIQANPMAQQVIGYENNVTELDVDIILEDVPDSVTIQHEQFQEIVGLAQNGVPIPPTVLIEASSLRNKKQLIEMLNQGPSPEQQLELQKTEAEINKLNAEALEEKTRAQANQNPLM